jgi:cobalt/nickel transport protein
MTTKRFLLAGLLVSLLLAVFVSFYASSSPDGLEKVAEDIGFIESAEPHAIEDSPLADYGVSGVDNDRLSVGLAGAIGVLLTAGVAFGGFMLLARKSKGREHQDAGRSA